MSWPAVTAIALVAWWACGLPRRAPPSLLEGVPSPPPEIRRACELAQAKCTRCHTIDRVRLVHVDTESQWEAYVARMRRQPGSAIDAAEADAIVSCLVYRSERGIR